jgi:hypothetical protein
MKLNFRNKELFEWKYKRQPKVWSIDQVHNLYLKTLERHNIRLRRLIDVRDRIINEVEEFERSKRKVYFTEDGVIHQRDFHYWVEYNSWGSSTNIVKFNNDNNVINRNEKLEFLLSNDKQFELGELYEKMRGVTRHLHLYIWGILSEMVEEKLRVEFKGEDSPEILTIDISGHKYYVVCDKQHMYNRFYKKFELKNKEAEPIKI